MVGALPHHPTRELSPDEIRRMLKAGDAAARALIGGLLSGLQVAESQTLEWSDVDVTGGTIRTRGQDVRTVPIGDEVRTLFQHHQQQRQPSAALVWGGSNAEPLSVEALDAVVRSAAYVAGVPAAQDVQAETLRATYVAFLARQGARLEALEQAVGHLSAPLREDFQLLSPPGPGEDLEHLERIYPALQSA